MSLCTSTGARAQGPQITSGRVSECSNSSSSLSKSHLLRHNCVLGGFKQFLVKNQPLDRRKGSTGPPPETHCSAAGCQQHRSYTGLYLTVPNPVICKELKCFLRRQKMGSAGLSPHRDAFRPSAGPAAAALSRPCRIPCGAQGLFISAHTAPVLPFSEG